MTKDSEERLLALLGPIHDRAQQTARRLCRSDSDGDDLFQDAVIRALDRITGLRDERAFGGWFHRILLSMHRTRARRSVWRRWSSLAEAEELIGDDGGRWEEERVASERVRRALSTLPDVQREAIVLFELDGYSLEEIAAWQGVSLSAVKSRLVRGRGRLERFYRRCFAQDELPTRAVTENGS